jgi:hypothetical protein
MSSEENTMESDEKQRRRDARAAGAEMRDARGEIGWFRFFLYWGVLFALGATGFVSWEAGSGEDPEGSSSLMLAFVGAATAILLGAVLLVDRWPVPVTLLFALLSTLPAVDSLSGALFDGEYEGLEAVLVSLFYWGIFFSALRLSRLARAHPESYAAQQMRGASGDESSGYLAQALEEHSRFKAKERRVVAFLYVVLGVLLILGWFGLWGTAK